MNFRQTGSSKNPALPFGQTGAPWSVCSTGSLDKPDKITSRFFRKNKPSVDGGWGGGCWSGGGKGKANSKYQLAPVQTGASGIWNFPGMLSPGCVGTTHGENNSALFQEDQEIQKSRSPEIKKPKIAKSLNAEIQKYINQESQKTRNQKI